MEVEVTLQYLSLDLLNLVVVILLAIIVVWKMRKERKAGYPREDERTAKIGGKAAIGAFWISYGFMLLLMIWNIFAIEFLAFPQTDAG
ncbi:MAG: hypothetical protein NWF10_05370 [Candidatus Bathyarchaeota archaeon]|jgi:hypothetical protein|nr:hypothetical protein [Candidatus Bathyarchaeota archaeon]